MSKFTAKTQRNTRGKLWMFYGVAGVGKTTQALAFHGLKNTYLVDLELGADHVVDSEGNKPVGISRISTDDAGNIILAGLPSIYELLAFLETQSYKAVVIDSATVLFNYILSHVNNKKFEYVAEGGWDNKNKGVEEANRFIGALSKLQEKGTDVIITGHSKMSLYNDPTQDKPYDRFTLDSPHDPMAQVFIRAADCVAFCHYEIEKKSESKTRSKVTGDGTALMLFEYRPWAPDCKNRANLPDIVEMIKDGSGLHSAISAASSSQGKTPDQLLAEVKTMMNTAPVAIKDDKAIAIAIKKAEGNLAELTRIKAKVATMIGAQ